MFIESLCNVISYLGSASEPGDTQALDPLYEAITTLGPYAMGIVMTLGVLYGIIMGVKFAKADESKERAAIQKALISGVVGFVVVLMLIAILYAIRVPLVDFMNS